MVLDLHLPKDWDLGADPLRELWNVQIPILLPMTLIVIEGDACDSINSREGISHYRARLTQ